MHQEEVFVNKLNNQSIEGGGGGYIQVSVDKMEGVDLVEQILDASAMVPSLFQMIEPF